MSIDRKASSLDTMPLSSADKTEKARHSLSLRIGLIISQCLAIFWWLVALYFYNKGNIPVWYDQFSHFTQAGNHLSDPFALTRFVYPPWTALALIPFTNMSIPLAALIQVCLYFGLLTLVIHKFGGNWRTALIVLTSYWAFDNAIQINIEWLVCVGLLLPAAWGAPFILMKPQVATGIWLSYKPKDLIRALAAGAGVFGLSLLIWGNWLPRIYANLKSATLGQTFNIAPLVLLPVPVALIAGAVLAWFAWRRRDPILSVLAWLFFVPYIAFYSLLLSFGLFAIKWPRWVLLISVVMWVAYGRILIIALFA